MSVLFAPNAVRAYTVSPLRYYDQQEISGRPTRRLSFDNLRNRTSSAAVIWVNLSPAVERAVLQQLGRTIIRKNKSFIEKTIKE